MIENRIKYLDNKKKININSKTIIYWMSREQRIENNWSLIYTLNLAKKYNLKIYIVFNLIDKFLEAENIHFSYLINGLKKVKENANYYNLNFEIIYGDIVKNIVEYTYKKEPIAIITDFDPLKIKINWQEKIQNQIDIPLIIVDSHNIVPVFVTSNKQEFAAYTIRPKIKKNLNNYLIDFPKIKKQNINTFQNINIDFNKLKKKYKIKDNLLKSGEENARKQMNYFIEHKLDNYDVYRNDPNKDYLSNMSKYLHFGQISAQEMARKILIKLSNSKNYNSYLDELIVRKELADNYCYFNKNYNNFKGLPNWGQKTLNEHRYDKREYIYSYKELEKSKTHDPLWNASQNQLKITGKMHGYLRMYWVKKILEWSENPETAIKYSINLNNKYEIDGRDPNGYVGILWGIGGLHDRAWKERKIFGKIRYMNFNGAKKKFDVNRFIEKYI